MKYEDPPWRILAVPLPAAKHDEVKAAAKANGLTMSGYARQLIYRDLRSLESAWSPPGTATR